MSAAAQSIAPVRKHAPLPDELVRVSRERRAERRLARRARLAFGVVAATFVAAGCAAAAFVAGGPELSWPTAALFVLTYALVSRIEFEIGTGAAIPTQLVLVPMLFALPVGLVPAFVALALVLAAAVRAPRELGYDRLLAIFASASQTLGPALVLGLAGGLPLRVGAWPIYLAALAAQFTCDFASAGLTSSFGHRVPLRTLAGFLGWVFAVDAALAPVGLAVAFAAAHGHALVLLALPLVALLRHFSHERRRRIDSALELSDAYRGTAFLLGDVIEADDDYTGAHSRHVVDLVLGVCDERGLGPADRRDAEFVALLHDVGKIRIPSEIINKAGPLDADEREVIETHTIEGERMLDRVGGLLGHVGRIVRSCHEHWDGRGYPDGLAGKQIPLVARIVCACDAFSAMTTDRPYRKARTHEEALAELQRCSGTQFDPDVVAAMTAVLSR
jgi:HD-GYP domain-containing protein (c-di-GMP phosphodiesterase class II)